MDGKTLEKKIKRIVIIKYLLLFLLVIFTVTMVIGAIFGSFWGVFGYICLIITMLLTIPFSKRGVYKGEISQDDYIVILKYLIKISSGSYVWFVECISMIVPDIMRLSYKNDEKSEYYRKNINYLTLVLRDDTSYVPKKVAAHQKTFKQFCEYLLREYEAENEALKYNEFDFEGEKEETKGRLIVWLREHFTIILLFIYIVFKVLSTVIENEFITSNMVGKLLYNTGGDIIAIIAAWITLKESKQKS